MSPCGSDPLREQARGRPVWSSRGGPGTSRLTPVVQGTPTSFSSSWCLGLLTLGLHPRACRGGLARPSPGARCGGSRASAWPPQGQLLAGGAGITPCSGLPTPERRVLGLPAPGAVGVRWAMGEPPPPPAPCLGESGQATSRQASHFLSLSGGPAFQKPSRLFVVDRRCALFPKTSHHEEKGTSFCLHLGLRVPYNVAKGNISQISVKLITKLQYPHESICFRC